MADDFGDRFSQDRFYLTPLIIMLDLQQALKDMLPAFEKAWAKMAALEFEYQCYAGEGFAAQTYRKLLEDREKDTKLSRSEKTKMHNDWISATQRTQKCKDATESIQIRIDAADESMKDQKDYVFGQAKLLVERRIKLGNYGEETNAARSNEGTGKDAKKATNEEIIEAEFAATRIAERSQPIRAQTAPVDSRSLLVPVVNGGKTPPRRTHGR